MKRVYTDEEYSRMTKEYDKVKYTCQCGHRVVIPYNVEKTVCSWCKNYVFKNKEDEFKYRLKQEMKKEK